MGLGWKCYKIWDDHCTTINVIKFIELKTKQGVPIVAQWLTNPTRNQEVAGSVPALAHGLRIRRCSELWCRLQMRLGSHVAVALA